MNLTEAYQEIWRKKLPGTDDPRNQHINRVEWTAGLFPDLTSAFLVDLGAGSGQMLAEATRRGWRSIGYDFDSDVCRWLQSLGYDAREADLSVHRLACEPADIITCCDVIEHLVDPIHAMREAFSILKPGGLLYVGTPNCSSWRRVKSLASGSHPRTSGDQVLLDGGHLGYYGPNDLTRLLRQAGFTRILMRYLNPDPVPADLLQSFHKLGAETRWLGHTYLIAEAAR